MNRFLYYIKTVSTYFGASLIPLLLSVAINPLIAMNMSPEDYAATGYFTSFNTLIGPIIIFYLLHYYVKRYFELDEKGRLRLRAILFKALIFFSFIVSVICFIILFVYIEIFNTSLQFPIFLYLIMTVFAIPLTGIYNLELSDYRMARKSTSFFRLSVSAGVLLVALNLLCVVLLKWGAFGKLFAPLVCNMLVFIYLLMKHHDLFRVKTGWEDFKPILIFCTPLALGAMLGYFSNGFDRTYLESIGNITEYGYYIVGGQIAAYLTTFSTAINSTFQPDIYESIIQNNRRQFIKICSVQMGAILGVVLVFIAICPFIIHLLTAGRYMASTLYARIIALSTFTSSIYYIINNFTIAKGKPRYYLYTTIIGSILIILVMPLMVHKFQYIGGAWMVCLSFVLLSLVNGAFLFLNREKQIDG